jgi:hypothetical protein
MRNMPPSQSHRPRSRQPSQDFPNATAATTLKEAMRLMAEWPTAWQIDDDDLACGE